MTVYQGKKFTKCLNRSGVLVAASEETLCGFPGELGWESMKPERRMRKLDIACNILHSHSLYNWQASLTRFVVYVCVCVCVYVWCHLAKWKESCLPGNLPAPGLIFPWQHFIHCMQTQTFPIHWVITVPSFQRLPCLSVSIGSLCRWGKILSYNFNLVPLDVSKKIKRKREGKKRFHESYVTAILQLLHLCLS